MKNLKYEINTKIEIHVPLSDVWNALIEFSEYERWNTFVPSISGELSKGAILNIILHVPNEKKQKYKVKILEIQEKQILQWLGHFIIPGLIDGNHIFQLQHLSDNKTLFIQKESFKGILVPFVWKYYLNTKLRAGFVQLNEGLKKHVENRHI